MAPSAFTYQNYISCSQLLELASYLLPTGKPILIFLSLANWETISYLKSEIWEHSLMFSSSIWGERRGLYIRKSPTSSCNCNNVWTNGSLKWCSIPTSKWCSVRFFIRPNAHSLSNDSIDVKHYQRFERKSEMRTIWSRVLALLMWRDRWMRERDEV